MKAVQFAEYGGRDVLEVVSIADFDAPTHGARVSTGFGQDKSPALREGVDLVTKGALRPPVAQVSPSPTPQTHKQPAPAATSGGDSSSRSPDAGTSGGRPQGYSASSPAPPLIGLPVNAKHRRDVHAYPPEDGPPTDELQPIPASEGPDGGEVDGRVRRWLRALAGRVTDGQGRSRTVLIVAGVALVLVAVAFFGYRAATNTDTAGDNTAAVHRLMYKATSTGKTVTVTYTQNNNDVDGQATAASPWSTGTTVTANVAVLTVISGRDANNANGADGVTCAIVDMATGQTLASKAAPPSVGATVTCVAGGLGA